MTNSQTPERTDPVHIIWLIGGVLVVAAIVFYIVGAIALHPSGYGATADLTKGWALTLVATLLVVGGFVSLVGGLVARAVRR